MSGSIDKLSKKKIDRRTLLKLGAGAVGALTLDSLLASCAPAPSPTPVPPTPTKVVVATPTPTPPKPKQGGTLVVALGANPEHLDISLSSSVMVGLPASAVTEGLVRINREYQLRPALAKSWEVSTDGKTVTFHLRTGVKWHDGRPFTSADVRYTFEKLSPVHPRAAPVLKRVESIEAPDDQTVVIKLKAPFGPFLDICTAENIGIQPKHIFEGTDPLKNPANLRPIGTGAFKFDSWKPGESIALVRNPDYWDPGKPYLDRLVFRVLPDSSARILALEAGDIDYISNYDIAFTDVARLEKSKEIVVERGRGHPRVLLLFFNAKKTPLSDVRVRRALFRALDRQLMLDSAYGGIGGLGTSSIPPGLRWAYNPDVDYMKMYAFDLKRADKELDDAGYPKRADGSRFEIRFLYDPAQPGFKEIADIVRANWGSVGVKVTLESRERSVWLDMLYMKKDYDTSIAFYTSAGDPFFGIQRTYICADIRPASFTNASQYCNPALDDLFEKGASAVTREERAKYYREAQTIIARDIPSAVLLDSGFADAIRDKFGNLKEFFNSPETTSPWYAEIYQK
ncbi:MAG: ABC transporter substrate-binding protein [Chloroflexi bacterium]|nr:ABC transporter substrate-binding protein [Chloroflexota bacterium]